MQGEHSSPSSFFGMIYEDLIPADHLLGKLAAVVDFGFVSHLVSDYYCPDNGRPSWDPLVLFKVVFLLFDKLRVVSNVEPQFLYDLSDREVEEQVNLHLACKSPTRHSRYGDGAWFAGLEPEEAGPDSEVFAARPLPSRLARITFPSTPRSATREALTR